ncbi:MAG: class I tRNA ligase family protein, partial [Pyrinomonadaceae bacterium]
SGDTLVPTDAASASENAFGLRPHGDKSVAAPSDKSVLAPSDLEIFLPTDVLVTGRDIIFLWVSRMMMLTKKFVDKKAFDDIIITGTVLGKDGKPMSKSRNNGVDPIEMFDKFGVDATRIYLASIATGADIRWNDIGVETYRNFANKIWNATRFCLMHSGQDAPPNLEGNRTLADRWIESRISKTALAVNRTLETYQFHEAVSLLYHFFWDDFCDWYIELKKDDITSGEPVAGAHILWLLDMALRMLHPFMPYLTEELWQMLPGSSNELHHPSYSKTTATIMLTEFPKGSTKYFDDIAENEMSAIIEIIKKVRNIRAEMNIAPSIKFDIHISAHSYYQKVFYANEAQILKLARADKIILSEKLDVPKASAKAVTADAEIAIPLEGLIDFEKERERLKNQIDKLDVELNLLNGQLYNSNFV